MRPALAWMVVALLAAPTFAGEAPDEAALRHLDVGIAAYRAGEYAQARREFEAARKLVPDKANPYRWLGMTDVQLGDCTQALLELETFLKLVPPHDERVAEATRLRDECQRTPLAAPPRAAESPAAPVFVAAPAPRPLARKWWFWTALGGGVAIAATGIALGVVLGTPHESHLPPIVCGATGCAP